MNDTAMPSSRSRRKLLLIAALFILPVVASWALFLSGWRPAKTGNYGELVQPARLVMGGNLDTLDGKALVFSVLRGKWTYVYFDTADCLKPCGEQLYKMRQVVATQGRDADRVQRALVVTDRRALDLLRYALKDYPGMYVFTGPAAEVERIAKQFALPAGTPLDGLHRIYLMDPLGNFVLSYPADADPTGMRKDLARLLRASQIG